MHSSPKREVHLTLGLNGFRSLGRLAVKVFVAPITNTASDLGAGIKSPTCRVLEYLVTLIQSMIKLMFEICRAGINSATVLP